jgi:NADH-quinone oxidoreductase subunit G
VVSLEMRQSAITEHADVVFPIAATAEKDGTFVGRLEAGEAVRRGPEQRRHPADGRVLARHRRRDGRLLRLGDPAAARAELHRLGVWTGVRAAGTDGRRGRPGDGRQWRGGPGDRRLLLDAGRPRTARSTGHGAGAAGTASASPWPSSSACRGDPVTVGTDRGRITLPLEITEMPDRVVAADELARTSGLRELWPARVRWSGQTQWNDRDVARRQEPAQQPAT